MLPRAYGLPKIHKPNCPLRIIVSSINSPLYNLSVFLHKFIYNILQADSNVGNSFKLVKLVSSKKIDGHYKLISLDAVSLFTNVPSDLAISGIASRWKHIKKSTKILLHEFIIAVQLVLDSTYFSFHGVIYRQTFGSPMGSPLSSVLTDIVLQDIEKKVLNISIHVPLYVRYVDDIALAALPEFIDMILDTFNSFHPRFQFTAEIPEKNVLNFLDVEMTVSGDSVECDWCRKPTSCGRYLNFFSFHPMCHKVGVIIGLFDRVFF